MTTLSMVSRKYLYALPVVAAVVLFWLIPTTGSQSYRAIPLSSSRPMMRIDVLDIGQGDSILIRSPEGKTALVDAGPTRDGASNQLKRLGVTSIDLVVISHHHSDHYGGMEPILHEFKPKFFMATGSSHTTKSYLKILDAVKSEGITAIEPSSKPRKIDIGSVGLTILPQPPEDVKEENDNSIGIRVQYGGFSMLMTGDSEADERRWWLTHCPELIRGCSVLKLAHHGSRNGTDAKWIKLIAPALAVVSVGKGNSFGHPHPETLTLLRQYKIPLLRTDERGTITLISNGDTWNYTTTTSD